MNNRLDSLILSSTSDRWQKVARIIAVVSKRHNIGANFDDIAARIVSLIDSGKLEVKGNISQWRHSEVRRAPSPV